MTTAKDFARETRLNEYKRVLKNRVQNKVNRLEELYLESLPHTDYRTMLYAKISAYREVLDEIDDVG